MKQAHRLSVFDTQNTSFLKETDPSPRLTVSSQFGCVFGKMAHRVDKRWGFTALGLAGDLNLPAQTDRSLKHASSDIRVNTAFLARPILRREALPGADDLFGSQSSVRGGPVLLLLILGLYGVDSALRRNIHFNLEKTGWACTKDKQKHAFTQSSFHSH